MKNRDIDDIMKNIGKDTVPPDVYKTAEDMSRDFSESLTESRQSEHHILFTRIAASRITRLAAAAIILVVFGTGFFAGRWSKAYQPAPAGVEFAAGSSASSLYPTAVESEDSFWRQKALAAMQPRTYTQGRFSEISSLGAYKQYLKEKHYD